MNNDLIERWKAVTCPPNDYIAELIAETIAALSPVLPEDAREWISKVCGARDHETNLDMITFYSEIANLIERLARNCKTIEESRDYWMREAEELQGEFENVLAGRGDTATRLLTQIAEYEKALKETAKALKKTGHGMAAAVVITELERIRGMK